MTARSRPVARAAIGLGWLAIVVVLLALGATTAFAATGHIAGTVTNNAGDPVADICVEVHTVGVQNYLDSTATEPDGTYDVEVDRIAVGAVIWSMCKRMLR